ncbi:circularly permuted type 2 ATP-grasp protein [Rudaeicoccus suwonensis]|uniref:Putative circularly permuted ATP-grasp superfamily protein n=1 Tax=Rudaeicoccus suwonensis TaxID=657409 RepID=A0A561EAT6_9MICO|nr:circularly permuted type 2 ATP-grasp protein [Rudaeicoccus suwonensis]TWE12735.1 putative circularly permuted ATP-grasp superfamily protein [Rudaeicoccus suwonensis]
MTALTRDDTSEVVGTYRQRLADLGAPLLDEVLTADAVRPASVDLVDRVNALGVDVLRARKAAARRYLQDDGVTYGVSADGNRSGQWRLDPLPVVIPEDEWRSLRAGLQQRAELLDLVLRDLYADRRLLRERVIPARAVLGHPGYLPQAVASVDPAKRQLILPCADLVRSSGGDWVVIGDRAQAPSGAGYAMADRRIVGRTMPGLYRHTELSRLRGFFDDMRLALTDAAAESVAQPRVVLLSPGPLSETAFDQAFVASLLGLPLVQSQDLTMRDGRVWLRTTGRLEPVDVILRRVDSEWTDPLDLLSASRLGVPGLLEAARTKAVRIVNPIGSGVLENPALLPYLDDAARLLLGEPLRLTSVRTWWCGDKERSREALDRLPELVIKRAGSHTRFGWELTQDEVDATRAQIADEPWAWSLQEQAPMSTVPVISGDGLWPRHFVLRTFGVGTESEYRFMPGGLGRVAVTESSRMVSNVIGSQAKDVWVLSAGETAVDHHEPSGWSRELLPGFATGNVGLAPRAAEDLFWLGRYAERAETGSRLLLVADDLVADTMGRAGTTAAAATEVLLKAISALTTVPFTAPSPSSSSVTGTSHGTPAEAGTSGASDEASRPGGSDELAFLQRLLSEGHTAGTIAFAVGRLIDAARAARELLSIDTWLILGRLDRALQDELPADGHLQPVVSQVLESLIALSGLSAESLVRDLIWSFLDAGRRVERAQQTVALLRHTVATDRAPITDGQVVEAVLRATDSLITHRRRIAGGQGPASPLHVAIDLLLRDRTNPRSVAFQLDRLALALDAVPDSTISQAISQMRQSIADFDIDAGVDLQRQGLGDVLASLNGDLRALASQIETTHFVRPATQQALSGGDLSTVGGRSYD